MNTVTTKAALAEARALKAQRDAQRKAHALRLLRGGVSLKETAAAISADASTVRKWKKDAGL